MFLIVGLGNPGLRYRKTRHNVGFMLVDRLARQTGCHLNLLAEKILASSVVVAGREVVLAKPLTYMNVSGQAVGELVCRFDVELQNVLVAYDEIALPLGRLRLRPSGSAGGHRGMQSVLDTLGTHAVPRLRIGISGERPVDNLSRYVLSRFRWKDRKMLKEVLERCQSAVEILLREGIEKAMALYN